MPRAKTGKYEVLSDGNYDAAILVDGGAIVVRIPPGGSVDELRRLLAGECGVCNAMRKFREKLAEVGNPPAKPRKATRKTKGRK